MGPAWPPKHERALARARSCFGDRKSTRLNSSHQIISYAVFCLKKKKHNPPYTEKDHPQPLLVYGVSKLTDEAYTQAYLDNTLILRTSCVVGPVALRTNRVDII